MKKLVILTGAGISAESGIQTFRDLDGLWEGHKVEEVASIQGWYKNRKLVLDFYNKRRQQLHTVLPNAGHFGLVDLEKHFDVTIITQNVDDLHERAGSKKVLHLHGELVKKRSVKTSKHLFDWGEEDINVGDKAPDGGQFRPHIVWFGEDVPMIYTANDIAADADIFVVIGTSLQVYPAAGLLMFAQNSLHKFLLDKKAPETKLEDFIVILKSAVEGIEELKTELIKLA
ncbi:MAG: NAD-dependent deacylase [Bacteroidia bacterium]